MNVWDIVKSAGIPALLLGVIITTWVQIRAVKRGVQALLRDRLIQGYKYYRNQGWADEDDRANLENVYVQYHALGANGVMDNLRQKFLDLPLGPQTPAPQTQAAGKPGTAAPATTSIDWGGIKG
jgi:hypothetical protein